MAHREGFSKWWPISFFIAAVLFFIMGGGMLGGWAANSTTYYSSSIYDYGDDYYYTGHTGLFYGGVACCVIGGVCKLVAWILLIVYCVKRSRNNNPSAVYVTQPVNNYPMQGNMQTAYAPVSNPSTPAPMYPNQGMRYCNNCGSAITTSFCPQCGVKS